MSKEVDNFDVIRDQLAQYGGRQKPAGEYHMVQCAFHQDGSPSMGVYIRRDHPTKTLGFFHCFGCGASGPWNKFADKAGLQKIKEWNNKESRVGNPVTALEEAKLLGEETLTLRKLVKEMRCAEAQPWPAAIEWRGFSGEFIREVGGHIINDNFNDTIAVLFPIKIAGKMRGGVKAVYVKRHKKQLGYVTMAGEWVNSWGLFPYEYTKKMIQDNEFEFVVLVEGPRDALRLLRMGIPAIAMLGANTVGKSKMLYIENLGVDHVYAMPDNDRGGDALWKNIKGRTANKSMSVKRLKLPREKDEDGKIIKMDPFSAPGWVMKNVRDLLRKRHAWRKPK